MKKSKSVLILIFLLCIINQVHSQQYGNEWINYDQEYYKIKTGTDGIHRLTYDNLLEAGVPLSALDPRNLQLFHRGEEVSIHIQGEEDGVFDTNDFIDFFGSKNDGTQDTELYLRPTYQAHTYYNLFSDTTAYFLTPSSSLGKRMVFLDESSTGLTPESHHVNEILDVQKSQFSFGQYYPIGNVNGETKLAQYDLGQGWIGNNIEKNEQTVAEGTNFRDFVVNGLVLREEDFGKPQFEIQIVGFGNVVHNASIYVGPSLDELRLIREDFILNYANHGIENQQIQWTDISSSGRLFIRVEEVGFDDVERDVIFVSYIKVTFPQEIDVQSQSGVFFNLEKVTPGLALLNIQNVVESQRVYDVTDRKNPIRIASADEVSNNVETVVNMSTRYRTIYTEDDTKYIEAKIESVSFVNEDLGSSNYVIISHPHLKQPGGGYDDPVQAYVDYRESLAGGAYDVYYADVMTLYDEFGYGEFTPLALKRFTKYAYDRVSPEYLFLIGKSRRVDNASWRLQDPVGHRHLVPTLGAPGSDIAYTAGLSGIEHYPAYPVGRLSVSSSNNVGYYLDKVIAKEASLKDSPWIKNFLHLSGGTSSQELNLFRSFSDGFGDKAASDYLGANVNNINKKNNNAVQFINISEEVNKGIGLITFFGHSSNRFTDIDIGFATDDRNGYENLNKYPVFMVNGCRGGEIFYFDSFGEDWIGAKNRGATSFISHTDSGLPVPLKQYTDIFYEIISDTLYMTKSIGHIQQKVIAEYMDRYFLDNIGISTIEENLLQGDPALQIFGNEKVDYVVRDEDIFLESIDGKSISSTTPFFRLAVIAGNSGRTTLDSLTIGLKRTLPDGSVRQLPEIKIPAVRFQDTVYFDISNQGVDAFGENTFEVVLDALNAVDEGSKLNNIAELTAFFPASGTFNTFPTSFGIINTDEVALVVQSAELKLNDKEYYVEIDTVNTFNSPWFQSNIISGKGIGIWNVDLTNTNASADTVQYYWRTVFVEELEIDPRPFYNSSFSFIRNGTYGWAQTAFDQFEDLDLVSLQKDEASQNWILVGSETLMELSIFGADHPSSVNPANSVVNINGTPYIVPLAGYLCALNSLNAIAFNKDTGQPYIVLTTDGLLDIDDPLTCGPSPSVINRFPTEVLSDITVLPSDSRMKAYVDGVRDDDYVLVFSLGSVEFQNFREDVRDDLGRIGTSTATLGSMDNGEPIIIFGQKGTPEGSATLVRAEPTGGNDIRTDKEILYSGVIKASTDRGSITSIPIGPASNWKNLYHKIVADPIEDVVNFDVAGVDADGNETILFTDITQEDLDISGVDSNTYPYLRLYLNIKDEVSATPAQLEKWLISYDGEPEGIVSLQNNETENIELIEGQPFDAEFQFTNISEYDFAGPLTVRYTFTNQTSQVEETSTIEIPLVAAGETAEFVLPIDTRGRIGLNDLEVFVNPGDQPEQFYNNNVLRLNSFYEVIRDNVNPAVDVTFDGAYILDGDLVSPSPLIVAELRDNNPYLLKEDTVGVDIYLKENCDTCQPVRINFSDPGVSFLPATANSNFRVEFQPDKMTDGSYNLQVEARDASGNQSGINPYTINFEVVNESSISSFYPYPNPFSTSTRFVFTITGDMLPDNLKIQIFTMTGKVVREITQSELGPIHVGNNISDFAWDGYDEFGDQLANGTYLYRVIAKINGQDIGHRGTGGDKGFRKGWGKLVILR
jgi:Peptidase family C25